LVIYTVIEYVIKVSLPLSSFVSGAAQLTSMHWPMTISLVNGKRASCTKRQLSMSQAPASIFFKNSWQPTVSSQLPCFLHLVHPQHCLLKNSSYPVIYWLGNQLQIYCYIVAKSVCEHPRTVLKYRNTFCVQQRRSILWHDYFYFVSFLGQS